MKSGCTNTRLSDSHNQLSPSIGRRLSNRHVVRANSRHRRCEAPAAYKDFDAVLDSVKLAGLASEVARLKARFVIKDAGTRLKGAA